MKTLIKIIIMVGFVLNGNAQEYRVNHTVIKINEKVSSFKISQNMAISNSLNLGLSPQFGGLFDASFKHVEGVSNLKKFYDKSDFGTGLAINQEMNKRMNLKTIYNVGILKFNNADTLRAKSYCIKISLSYVF